MNQENIYVEDKKVCFLCNNHDNPYLDEMIATDAADQNFVIVEWFGINKTDDVHDECWYMENR